MKTIVTFILAGSLLSASSGASLAGDAVAGEQSFKKCKACHQIGETAKNAVGPMLNGVVGRPAGQIADYNYSDANKSSGLTWDEVTLAKYLKSPRDVVPGTKMTFPGFANDSDVRNVIAYLKQFNADGTKM